MEDVPHVTGSTLVDEHAEKIGTITDVLSDDRTLEPRWAVVSYGFPHKRTLVPMSELYQSEDGRVVTRLDRSMIRGAPKVHGDVPDPHVYERYYS